MAGTSSIEWTGKTWNPVTGCTAISPGCDHCYAEKMAKRLKAMKQPQYRNGFEVTLAPQALDAPRRWRKPRLVFVNSMSDLFHEKIKLDYIQKLLTIGNQAVLRGDRRRGEDTLGFVQLLCQTNFQYLQHVDEPQLPSISES